MHDLTQAERNERARNWLIDGRIADDYPLFDAPVDPPFPLHKPAPLPEMTRTKRNKQQSTLELADEQLR